MRLRILAFTFLLFVTGGAGQSVQAQRNVDVTPSYNRSQRPTQRRSFNRLPSHHRHVRLPFSRRGRLFRHRLLFPVVLFAHRTPLHFTGVSIDSRLEAKGNATTDADPTEADALPADFATDCPDRSQQDRLHLIVLKNGSVYPAERYWKRDGILYFEMPGGVTASLPLDDWDSGATTRLNRETDCGQEADSASGPGSRLVRPNRASRHIYVPVPVRH